MKGRNGKGSMVPVFNPIPYDIAQASTDMATVQIGNRNIVHLYVRELKSVENWSMLISSLCLCVLRAREILTPCNLDEK